MIYLIDIDGTICTQMKPHTYHLAQPYMNRILLLNDLFENNTINYWTARGSGCGIDYSELTKRQLLEWGVKYDSLNFGKPVYDVWVDDKAKWLFD